MCSSMLDWLASSERQMIEAEAALFRHQDRRCNAGHILDLAGGSANEVDPISVPPVSKRSTCARSPVPKLANVKSSRLTMSVKVNRKRLCSIKFLWARLGSASASAHTEHAVGEVGPAISAGINSLEVEFLPTLRSCPHRYGDVLWPPRDLSTRHATRSVRSAGTVRRRRSWSA